MAMTKIQVGQGGYSWSCQKQGSTPYCPQLIFTNIFNNLSYENKQEQTNENE